MDILRLSQNGGRCYNMYDVRLDDSYPSCGMNWPPDLKDVKPYLRRKDVTNALHVNKDKQTGWTECSGEVGSNFKTRTSKPSIQLLPDLLQHMPVVLFSGDQDLICNHLGTEEMIHNMKWNSGQGFELSPGTWAPRRDWTFEGEPAGIYQEARNLTYVLFYNSSHMVPFDYPRRSRDMLDRFMNVDIASIGGKPTDSRIDGEKGVQTSVGGHPNSTIAEQVEEDKLEDAKWHAYYRSGEVVLVIVIIAASAWGWWVWRSDGSELVIRAFLEARPIVLRAASGTEVRPGTLRRQILTRPNLMTCMLKNLMKKSRKKDTASEVQVVTKGTKRNLYKVMVMPESWGRRKDETPALHSCYRVRCTN